MSDNVDRMKECALGLALVREFANDDGIVSMLLLIVRVLILAILELGAETGVKIFLVSADLARNTRMAIIMGTIVPPCMASLRAYSCRDAQMEGS